MRFCFTGDFVPFFEKKGNRKKLLIIFIIIDNRKLKVKRSLKISADECKVQNENIAKIDVMRK